MASIESLNYFLELSNYSNIIQAANALHISPSGLSMSIKNLEKDLGIKLLHKKRNEIVFTDNGRELLAILGDFFVSLAALKMHSMDNNFSKDLTGKIDIYTTGGSIYNALPSILPHMHKTFPKLNINIKHYNYIEIVNLLAQGKIQFAFLFQILNAKGKSVIHVPENIVYTKLFDCQTLYHVPNKFKEFSTYTSISAMDLQEYVIIYNLPKDETAFSYYPTYKISTRKKIFEPDLALFTSYIENGIGIGQTLYSNYNKYLPHSFKNCYTLPSGDEEKIAFCYVTNTDTPLSELNRKFLDYIKSFTLQLKQQIADT